MNKIGFTNFRKFKKFPTIDLGGITILVGGNNAGKSSLVKALLLMRDFIQTRIVNIDNVRPVFKFDTEHVNIGNFSRAFCKKSKKTENTISFEFAIEEFIINVDVKGDRYSDMLPIVSYIRITDSKNRVYITVDNFTRIILQFGASEEGKKKKTQREALEKKLKEIKRYRFKSEDEKDIEAIVKYKAEEEQLLKEIKALGEEKVFKDEIAIIENLEDISGYTSGNLLLPELIKGIVSYSTKATMGKKNTDKYKSVEAYKAIIKSRTPLLNGIATRLNTVISNDVMEYIYAHSVSQQVFYNIVKDSNDYVTRVIHEFYQARITEGDEEFIFLQRWMKEFEIGSSVEVLSMKGEAYQVVIYDKENKQGIDLADKGMGSIQMTILLLRIATLMRIYKGANLIILLEEPEQNLHPALQSKLADLLLDIFRSHGFQFIIETHSEYLVRKTQVIVAETKDSVLPFETFKCYYLPNDGKKPYEMKYRPDGKFSNEFGSGFFDTASLLAFELF